MPPEENTPADDNAAKPPSDGCGQYTYTWSDREQPAASASPCPDCRGRGSIRLLISTQPCPRCQGSGSLPATPAPFPEPAATKVEFRYDAAGNLTVHHYRSD
jgi:hypothetical protein